MMAGERYSVLTFEGSNDVGIVDRATSREGLVSVSTIDVYMLIWVAFKVDPVNASVCLEYFLTEVS